VEGAHGTLVESAEEQSGRGERAWCGAVQRSLTRRGERRGERDMI